MEVTERNSGNLDHGYMVMMGSLEQDPGGPSNQTKNMDGGGVWEALAGAGGAVEAETPAHPRVAWARQEGAPAALPALGRDKGWSPGPSSAGAVAATAARAPRVRAAGPAPGATPAPRPPPPDFSAPEVVRAQAGVAGDLEAPARPPPARLLRGGGGGRGGGDGWQAAARRARRPDPGHGARAAPAAACATSAAPAAAAAAALSAR